MQGSQGMDRKGHSARMLATSHDINYVAISGLLSLFGRYEENPIPPVNVLADTGDGGSTCAMGILLAIIERHKSGIGQLVDSSMPLHWREEAPEGCKTITHRGYPVEKFLFEMRTT
ncbi:hypothetical protein JTB14_035214 [Gonioctena quinquepunctata]|nr:hypothetical protein JTB14_035214 [Gonioctena quinquepunctata]